MFFLYLYVKKAKKSINQGHSVTILASMHTGPYGLKNKYTFRQFTGLFKIGRNTLKKAFKTFLSFFFELYWNVYKHKARSLPFCCVNLVTLTTLYICKLDKDESRSSVIVLRSEVFILFIAIEP